MCRGDYAEHYYKFSQLYHFVWNGIRISFLQEDISLHLAVIPSRMQEKHLTHVATYMEVCIHILCFDAMGREIAKYGNSRGTQHLYIYIQDCHYHPIYKVHCLPASGDGRPAPSNCVTIAASSWEQNLMMGVLTSRSAPCEQRRMLLQHWNVCFLQNGTPNIKPPFGTQGEKNRDRANSALSAMSL
jgi:hypothetical protein